MLREAIRSLGTVSLFYPSIRKNKVSETLAYRNIYSPVSVCAFSVVTVSMIAKTAVHHI